MDSGTAIARDPQGKRIYITGSTTSINFPITDSVYQETFGGEADGFVVKFHVTTGSVLYSTYLGGSNEDVVHAIAVNRLGHAFVVGTTNSTDFPTTSSAVQGAFGGLSDNFITVLNSRGTALFFSTYLGTPLAEEGHGLAIDASNHIFVTGTREISAGSGLNVFVTKIRLLEP